LFALVANVSKWSSWMIVEKCTLVAYTISGVDVTRKMLQKN
jgi:hypothetical protein